MKGDVKFEKPAIHTISWAIFITYDWTTAYLLGQPTNPFLYIIPYGLQIAVFYYTAHVILPASFKNNQIGYPTLIASIIAELLIYTGIRYVIVKIYLEINPLPSGAQPPDLAYLSSFAFRGVRVLGYSIGYWFALRTYYNRKKINDLEINNLKSELKTEELQKTLLVTENAYLKSQINPHFLLNTLNFLYNSVAKFSDKIADSVMTLSEMMRYALTNTGDDNKVNLEDELDHVGNLVKLNQARFNERLNIEYTIKGDPGRLRIIPLALITLAENLFKYGDLLDPENPARISVEINQNKLRFVTENVKKQHITARSHGIGIKNIKERLKMYHDYALEIDENEHFYKSALTIDL